MLMLILDLGERGLDKVSSQASIKPNTAIMAEELNGLQSKIKETYPIAFFKDSFINRINLILSQT